MDSLNPLLNRMPFLRLFNQFIIRKLYREKARSTAALLGIAAGIAVIIAIRLANSAVTDTFRAAIDAVGGEASLRIRGTTGRFDEQLFSDLERALPSKSLSPVIAATAMVVDGKVTSRTGERFPRGELLQVLGVDVLRDFEIRDYDILKASAGDTTTAQEMLSLLIDPRSAVLTEKFMRRHGLVVGDEIQLTFDSEPKSFVIRGVLQDKGPAKTLDGNFALMDIATAQLAASRLGFLDYVDVRLAEGADPDKALASLTDRLPSGLVAEPAAASFDRTNTMLAAFQFNLEALSTVALVVGLFLVYNTIAISVAARRDEIGILQACGASRNTVAALFLGEATLLALGGVALGLPLGRALASYTVDGAAQTVETFYIAGIAEASAAELSLRTSDLLLVISLVIPMALFAAFVPAREAASVPPVEAVRSGSSKPSRIRVTRAAASSGICVAIGLALTQLGPIAGKPIAGFVAELFFMLAGAFLAPLLLVATCKAFASVAKGIAPPLHVEMRLAAANLVGVLPRVSVSVAALAISLSMMIAIAIMVGSFRETVVSWLDTAFSADLAVKPVMQSSAVSEARLSPRAVEIIRNDPEVTETLWVTSRQFIAGDSTIRVAVTEIDKLLSRTKTLFKQAPATLGTDRPFDDRGVLISESFSLLRDVERGDTIELPTSSGNVTLQVAGVYFDYASNQGTVLMDLATYRRLYSDTDPKPAPQSLSVHLKPDADPAAVRRRIQTSLGDDEQLYCVTSKEIRQESLRIFESTFAITYALQAIAILVAGAGVASTLVTLIYQRQRELGLLSLVGATAAQVERVIVCEAIVLGAVSQLIGVIVGFLLSLVLIYVINVQSFGWTIQLRIPWVFIVAVSALVVASSALFGFIPAIRTAAADPMKTIREC